MRRARLKVESRTDALRDFSSIDCNKADLLRSLVSGFWGGPIHTVNKPWTTVNNY